jgi:hypothetical protein
MKWVQNVQGQNRIADFEVGIDSFLLKGLTLEQLELSQQGNDVRIEFIETNEILAIVQNVQIEELSESFV